MVDWDLRIFQKWPHTNLVVNLQSSLFWFYTYSNPWNVRGHAVGAACVDTVRPTRSRQVTKNLSCVHYSVKRDEQGMFKYFWCGFEIKQCICWYSSIVLFLFSTLLFSTLLFSALYHLSYSLLFWSLPTSPNPLGKWCVCYNTCLYMIIYVHIWCICKVCQTHSKKLKITILWIDTLLGSLKPTNAPHDTSKVEGVER